MASAMASIVASPSRILGSLGLGCSGLGLMAPLLVRSWRASQTPDLFVPALAGLCLGRADRSHRGLDRRALERALGHDQDAPETRPLGPGQVVTLGFRDRVLADHSSDAHERGKRQDVVRDAHGLRLGGDPPPQLLRQELGREPRCGRRVAEHGRLRPVVGGLALGALLDRAALLALGVARGLLLPGAVAAGAGAMPGPVGRLVLRRAVVLFSAGLWTFADVGVSRLRALDGSDDVVGAIPLALLRGMVRAVRPEITRHALGREAKRGECVREALVPAARAGVCRRVACRLIPNFSNVRHRLPRGARGDRRPARVGSDARCHGRAGAPTRRRDPGPRARAPEGLDLRFADGAGSDVW